MYPHVIRRLFRPNALLHTAQEKGRSPLCIILCLTRRLCRRNALLLASQVKSRSPLWSACVLWDQSLDQIPCYIHHNKRLLPTMYISMPYQITLLPKCLIAYITGSRVTVHKHVAFSCHTQQTATPLSALLQLILGIRYCSCKMVQKNTCI
jgi:hypothetical protein